jgi:hypothetical protein
MVPGLYRLLARPVAGDTHSAAYCYSVWLKHMTLLWEAGMRAIPSSVAELGPGESLGIGLAALLSGASRFYALDVVAYSNAQKNLRILDELVTIFQERAPNPTPGWPAFDGEKFHREIIPAVPSAERISAIREAILHPERNGEIVVRYIAPWTGSAVEHASVDLIYSHSVLEHVTDVAEAYACCAAWLTRDGWMSHQIDFSCHGVTKEWNGHWQYPQWLWKIIVGGRPYLINRVYASEHIRMMEAAGFQVVAQMRRFREDGVKFQEPDASCCGMYVQARHSEPNSERIAGELACR